MNNKFTEDDQQKMIDFLNIIANKAEFTLKTEDLIKYFKLLAHMQQAILPKINDNILEIKQVIEPETKPTKKATRNKGK